MTTQFDRCSKLVIKCFIQILLCYLQSQLFNRDVCISQVFQSSFLLEFYSLVRLRRKACIYLIYLKLYVFFCQWHETCVVKDEIRVGL